MNNLSNSNEMMPNHDYHSYFQPALEQEIMNDQDNMNMNMNMNANMPRVNCRNDNWNNSRNRNWNGNWNNNMQNNQNGMISFNTMPSVMSSNNNLNSMSNMNTSQNTISFQPESITNSDFLPAYLKQFIGKWVRADFLIGNAIEQRVGILEDVGASYIILNAIEPQTLIICDLFAVKFVTVVLDDSEYPKLLLV